MQALFTRLLAASLALTLVLTAETMAMARGASAPVGEIILCTSHGIVGVPVDANGTPTEPAHICPDCLTFLASLQGDSGGLSDTRILTPQPFTYVQISADVDAIPSFRLARGPPETS